MDADHHLGQVLSILAGLHPDDRCQAFVDALAFYNAAHPDAQVYEDPAFITRIVYEGPMDRAIAATIRGSDPHGIVGEEEK